MEKVYKSEEEVLKAIEANGSITGVVAFNLYDLIDKNSEYIDDTAREKLVGGDYAYQVYNPSYSIVGTDVDKNVVFLSVTVDASAISQ